MKISEFIEKYDQLSNDPAGQKELVRSVVANKYVPFLIKKDAIITLMAPAVDFADDIRSVDPFCVKMNKALILMTLYTNLKIEKSSAEDKTALCRAYDDLQERDLFSQITGLVPDHEYTEFESILECYFKTIEAENSLPVQMSRQVSRLSKQVGIAAALINKNSSTLPGILTPEK